MTTDKLIRALRVWAEKMTMSGRRELVRQAADRLEELDEAPSVDVVPLDKLCEWMASTQQIICKIDKESWKKVITKWMEETDA